MADTSDLATVIQQAMEEKHLDQDQIAEKLGVSDVMAEKIVRGDIVPSTHLEKQMVEILEIPAITVHRASAKRQAKSKSQLVKESKQRVA